MLQESFDIMDSQDEVRKLQQLVKTLELQSDHLRVAKQRNHSPVALSCSWTLDAEDTLDRIDLQWEPSLNESELELTHSIHPTPRHGVKDQDTSFWDELEVIDLEQINFSDDESWLCESPAACGNNGDKGNKSVLDWLYEDDLPIGNKSSSMQSSFLPRNLIASESPRSPQLLRSQHPSPDPPAVLSPHPVTSRLEYFARRFTPSPDRSRISAEKEFAMPAPVALNTSSTPRNIDTRTFTRPKKKLAQFGLMPSPVRQVDTSGELEDLPALNSTFTAPSTPKRGAPTLNNTYVAEDDNLADPLLNETFEIQPEQVTASRGVPMDCESDKEEEDVHNQTRTLNVSLNQTFVPQKMPKRALASPLQAFAVRNQAAANLNATYTAEDDEGEQEEEERQRTVIRTPPVEINGREKTPQGRLSLLESRNSSRYGSNNSLLSSHQQDVQDVLLAACRQEESLELLSSTPLRLGGVAGTLRGAGSASSLGSPIVVPPASSTKPNGYHSEGSLADFTQRTQQTRTNDSPSPTPSSAASSPHSSQSLDTNPVSIAENDSLVRRSMPNLAVRKVSGISRLAPPTVGLRHPGVGRLSIQPSESRLRPPAPAPPIRMSAVQASAALNTTRPVAPSEAVFKQPQVPVRGISRLQPPSKIRPVNGQPSISAPVAPRVSRPPSQAPLPVVQAAAVVPAPRLPVAAPTSGLRPPSFGIPRPVSRLPTPRYR